jgi:hypothetical protein
MPNGVGFNVVLNVDIFTLLQYDDNYLSKQIRHPFRCLIEEFNEN